ncbi:hypothetical protein L211DRAFT_845524 [Terfezia boudieri ATCC MYA-4762]|uniref:Uncharacterized protein n=1 Tax=Terfezia boudieri ATCC MYA-4762 TaxID=1051890 RepID=A0A3N4M724_9PEZI|nr:hypothetical protein L211DRAFT_845524 [Terfezia boudieri ATCC MYA-4762]
MGLPLCRDPPTSPPKKTTRDTTASARSYIRRRPRRRGIVGTATTTTGSSAGTGVASGIPRRNSRLDPDHRSSQQVLLDLLQFTQGEGNVGVNGGLSTAATTASSNVSVSSSSAAGEASTTAVSGSSSGTATTNARQPSPRRNLSDLPPPELENLRQSFQEREREREFQRNRREPREPRESGFLDDHYVPPYIIASRSPYNMPFQSILSPVLRAITHSPPHEVRNRSRSRSPARERGMDTQANRFDPHIIDREIQRRRERNESLRSAFGPGWNNGRWNIWNGRLSTQAREGEGEEEQPSGNGNGGSDRSPGRWGGIYTTRNPNPEGEEQASYVRESARQAERAARFMESIRVHVREFGGGGDDGGGGDHSPWNFFSVPSAMDIPPQGGAGVDLLTQCDFGSDAESEIDGPEMGSTSRREREEREGEPDTSTAAAQDWNDVHFGDAVLEGYRERRTALARLRGEMEVVSRAGRGGSEGSDGGAGAGGV